MIVLVQCTPLDYTAGFGQGVRRSTESLAAILGGIWGGAVFDISYSYYFYYGVPTGLLLLALVCAVVWIHCSNDIVHIYMCITISKNFILSMHMFPNTLYTFT